MRVKNLGTHFANLTDVRPAENPWGITDAGGNPFTPLVRRDGHPDWDAFKGNNSLQDPTVKKMREATIRAALSIAPRKGFKADKQEKPEKVVDRLVYQIVNDPSDPEAAAKKLGDFKKGIAKHLWVGNVFGLVAENDDGTPIDLSTWEGRLQVLMYTHDPVLDPAGNPVLEPELDGEGNAVLEGGVPKMRPKLSPQAITPFKLDPKTKEELLDADEDPIPNPYGGMLFGDAIAQFIQDEAAKVESYRANFLEGAAGNSAATPAGSTATGSPDEQTSAAQ